MDVDFKYEVLKRVSIGIDRDEALKGLQDFNDDDERVTQKVLTNLTDYCCFRKI